MQTFLQRTALLFLLLFCSTFVLAQQKGVIFVMGKGPSERDPTAYWGQEMIDIVSSQFPLNYLVDYDGTLNLADAAEVIAEQVIQFMEESEVTQPIFITHSYGGVALRWILSNPDVSDSFKRLVDLKPTIYAIAPPNAGSEAADLIYQLMEYPGLSHALSWLGEDNPAAYDMQTAKMAYYNSNFMFGTQGRPTLPKGINYFTVAGIKAWNYWYVPEDLGLTALSQVAGFRDLNDGMVSIYSAESVGHPFKPHPRTTANHSNNRRNHYDPYADKLVADMLTLE